MRVWLYARLSNDDDQEMNSLLNQQEICQAFADQHGYIIVGQSFDDNVSGMKFNRRGLDELTAAVDADKIDAVIVKDLSRLGRHRTQTALFIDYLREHQVRVISATEGIDTFRDEDDLIIGIRGLMNDYYARDISKKIRAGYRQKQREGIVITPPFGYRKDRNTNTIELHPEASETVRMVYSLYLQGLGQKEIARRLNALGRKTPAQLRAEQCGKEVCAASKTSDGRYVWTYASVKNILVEEAYTGVLINHRSETNGGKAKRLEQAEWYRHENFFPVIIERDIWEKVQQKLKAQARPANGNKAKHRYAGLILCKECGSPFVPMIRYWNSKRRVEYVCKGYHRNGKSYCSSHRVHEEVLDAAVQEFAQTVRIRMAEEQKELKQKQKMWALRKPVLDAHIFTLQGKIQQLEGEIDDMTLELLKNHNHSIS
ncbi:recombinase family protein [Flavonifractor sp. AGMB03687]|uniref:recombinase family protein n=1 Tax=Flavonifractor sp. AGMB03687 TaxID=2785133 RepID=UPI001ADFED12|nr:recombinase family protein [Flavonifractor sp. AGMB03687]